MHALTGTFAFAGRNQKVIGCVVIAEAKFAVAPDSLVGLVNAIKLTQKQVFLFLAVSTRKTTDFNNSVLNSA
jgi:hypothetical protein